MIVGTDSSRINLVMRKQMCLLTLKKRKFNSNESAVILEYLERNQVSKRSNIFELKRQFFLNSSCSNFSKFEM